MKSLGALGTHYQQSVTTLADVMLVTRADGQQFGFAGIPEDIRYGGITYLAALGYQETAVSESSNLSVDNLDIVFLPLPGVIEEADLLAGKWDGAAVELRRINYANITMTGEVIKTGTIGQIEFRDGHYRAELRSPSQRMQTNIGRTLQIDCDADFGDARCKKNIVPLTVTGTLTSITSVLVFADAGRGEAAAFFDLGQISFTSGANNGFTREVKTHATGGIFTLQEGMPYLPAVGDAYSLHPGCDKSETACTAYANFANFRGHPHLIGINAMLRPGGV